MKLIIDIPEEIYERFGYEYREENLISKHTNDIILNAFCNGTPLDQESKTGHWIFIDKAHEHAHCSECDYGNVDLLDGRPHNYCPNCGAKMVKPQESEEISDTNKKMWEEIFKADRSGKE